MSKDFSIELDASLFEYFVLMFTITPLFRICNPKLNKSRSCNPDTIKPT